jgi:hypothetical protein
MAYSPIEEKYLNLMVTAAFPDAMPDEPQQVAEPSLDGVQLAMGSSGAAGRKSDLTMTDAGMGMLDMGAATVKGMTQGFVGLPGDLEGIGRMVVNMMGGNVDEQTSLPTTEEVKEWLDKNVGKVGDGKSPYETLGEFVAPGGYVKAAKTAKKAKKAAAGTAAAAPASVDGEEKK